MENILSLFIDANCNGKLPLVIFDENGNEVKKSSSLLTCQIANKSSFSNFKMIYNLAALSSPQSLLLLL
jgi:hypothetical protein